MTTETQTPVVEEVETVTNEAAAPEQAELEVDARIIYLMEDSVKVVMENGLEKYISYETFQDLVADATRTLAQSKPMAGFNLPSNVFYFANSHQEIRLSCYYQSTVKPLRYYDRNMEVITPNIIISHTLKNERSKGEKSWVVSSSRYFCTDKNVGNLDRTFIDQKNYNKGIHIIPMSNTYEDGRMCYGDNSMPKYMTENNLRSLDWYYQYLWETPFNDDLGIRAGSGGMSVKHWYEHLAAEAKKDEPKFPYDKLSNYNR